MKIAFFTLSLLFVGLIVTAQEKRHGVYATATDFVNDRLTLSSTNHTVKLTNQSVRLRCNGQVYSISKLNLFGARTQKGIFRFQNGQEYQLVNQDLFSLYHRSFPFGGDTGSYEDVYYFSIKPDSEIIPLTKENLTISFKHNPKFLAMVEVLFKSDSELADFNRLLNRYTLLYFYEESLKYSDMTAER